MASTYHQLGMVAHDRDDYDQALDYYRQALTLSEELGNRDRMASSISQIGILLTDTGNPDDGLIWNLRSLGIRAELGVPQIAINVHWLHRQRELLGTQRFDELLQEELRDEDSEVVRELLQQLSDNEQPILTRLSVAVQHPHPSP